MGGNISKNSEVNRLGDIYSDEVPQADNRNPDPDPPLAGPSEPLHLLHSPPSLLQPTQEGCDRWRVATEPESARNGFRGTQILKISQSRHWPAATRLQPG